MPSKMPPVPPASRSNKGTGGATEAPKDTAREEAEPQNLDQQGDEGNISQNTHNVGYQQDR